MHYENAYGTFNLLLVRLGDTVIGKCSEIENPPLIMHMICIMRRPTTLLHNNHLNNSQYNDILYPFFIAKLTSHLFM